jgi:hypothetical protein
MPSLGFLLIITGTTRMFFGVKKTQNCSPYFNVRQRQYPKRLGNPSILLPTASCKYGNFCPIYPVLFVHFFDLEDMGLKVDVGGQMCYFIASQGLAEAELSNLQCGEASRLLARRGTKVSIARELDDRLRQFINRSATFALANKKTAYGLTHIVYYLSEYGRRIPNLACCAVQRTQPQLGGLDSKNVL